MSLKSYGGVFGSLGGTVVVLFLFSGCGDDKKYERVTYAPTPLHVPFRVIDVPDAQAGAPPGDAPTFAVPVPLQPGDVIEIAGKFRPKEPGKIMYMVVNINATVVHKGQATPLKTTFATSTEVMPKEDKGGYWIYRVKMSVPKEPREYDVEILHFGDLVATGKIKVE